MTNGKAILFDFGDTLVSHLGSKSGMFRWICDQADVPLPGDPEIVRAAAAAGWREGMKRVNPADWKDLSWREHVFRAGLTEAGIKEELEGYIGKLMRIKLPRPTNAVGPNVYRLLGELRDRGYKLGIVSNYYGNLAEALEQTKLAPLFDSAIDSDVVGLEKPDPRIFRLCCDELEVEPAEAVYVGDMPPYDVDGAIRAGLLPILLDPCGIWKEAGDYAHIPNIRSLDELADIFLE
ncbi:HAD family hydrolase [Cohnella thailandensis]|uniref:HAD family hydrolase n=1 Tax=Cohnella thailandensis TaxID=557557 RepID=A0A841T391_9BACL|nr:HAD family hydrolase [Cohnella thailandensis]MBB6637469.1 HAD family hydrolase [Cohnella thailandensis]MBP1977502.1 HAD superfamily hydrolase (TIGR01509 family) [Cohnella thailandensis]